MSRIIAGSLGSLRLRAAAKPTRPTSDRVKESLFAQLEAMDAIENAQVLDLFAGTGALGLEAASRGASKVQFVEKDAKAFEVLQSNIALVQSGLEKQNIQLPLQSKRAEATGFLIDCEQKFSLVFIDPPYEYPSAKLQELMEKLAVLLVPNALVIVERSSRENIFNPSTTFSEVSEKTYGDTRVQVFRKEN